jgi:hypothetical protein
LRRKGTAYKSLWKNASARGSTPWGASSADPPQRGRPRFQAAKQGRSVNQAERLTRRPSSTKTPPRLSPVRGLLSQQGPKPRLPKMVVSRQSIAKPLALHDYKGRQVVHRIGKGLAHFWGIPCR